MRQRRLLTDPMVPAKIARAPPHTHRIGGEWKATHCALTEKVIEGPGTMPPPLL